MSDLPGASGPGPGPVDGRLPAVVRPAGTPELGSLLTLAGAVVAVAGLYLGREVLIPITLAVLLSFLLAPLVNLLRRAWLGRVPSVLLAVVLALAVILSLASLIGTQIADLAGEAPRYEITVRQKIDTVQHLTLGRVTAIMQRLGRQIDAASRPTAAPPGQPAADGGSAAPKPLPVEVEQPPASPMSIVESVVSPVLAPLGTTFVVFIVAIFVLLQREDLRDRLIRLFGSGDLHRTTNAMNDAARRLSKYFLTQLAINASFGVIIGTGLAVIGVPSPVLWGILGTLLRFVPYVGAPLSAILPVTLAAAVEPGWSMAIATVALYAITELIMGQVVEPLMYGHSTGLSPISVVVAATFWTFLWGPIGLILSTPLTLCLVVLGRHVDRLEFLDVLLGDRPALTPVESFYQRMLAGDPDEAHDQAELLLRERSLSSYYDEVAMAGLRLAANDMLRGALTGVQAVRVRESVMEFIDELDAQEDEDPPPSRDEGVSSPSRAERELPRRPAPKLDAPPREEMPPEWRGDTPVLCVAGRGPLDEAASAMLAQLLEKHGLGARTVAHEAASRNAIHKLDLTGVAMVCVSYLEISGSPSHLRYLLRRLRARLPAGVPVLVGMWPAGEGVPADARLRAAIGADHAAGSLREAVQICVAAAHGHREVAAA